MPLASFLTPKPIGCTPRGCSTGNIPAAAPYSVTGPPLERRRNPPGPSFSPFLREEMGAPAAQACPPGGTPANNGGGKPPPYSAWQFPRQPGFYQTGDHRSPLHRRPKLRIIRFRVNAKAHSLRWASFSPRRPLRWVAAGAPLGAPGRAPRASGYGGRRADDIRPYRVCR